MGIRTDLTSLGAIGIGAAVAVVGTGTLLFASVARHVDDGVCVSLPTPAAAPEAPAAPTVASVIVETTDGMVDVAGMDDATGVAEVAEAPEVHEATEARVVIVNGVDVRTECVVDGDRNRVRVRAHTIETARSARAKAAEARAVAEGARALAAEIRAEAIESGEVSPDRIEALVEAALAEAGISR